MNHHFIPGKLRERDVIYIPLSFPAKLCLRLLIFRDIRFKKGRFVSKLMLIKKVSQSLSKVLGEFPRDTIGLTHALLKAILHLQMNLQI